MVYFLNTSIYKYKFPAVLISIKLLIFCIEFPIEFCEVSVGTFLQQSYETVKLNTMYISPELLCHISFTYK